MIIWRLRKYVKALTCQTHNTCRWASQAFSLNTVCSSSWSSPNIQQYCKRFLVDSSYKPRWRIYRVPTKQVVLVVQGKSLAHSPDIFKEGSQSSRGPETSQSLEAQDPPTLGPTRVPASSSYPPIPSTANS